MFQFQAGIVVVDLLGPPNVSTKSLKSGEVQPTLLKQGPLERFQALVPHVKALSHHRTNLLFVRQEPFIQMQKLPYQRQIHSGRVLMTQQPLTVPNWLQCYPGRPASQLGYRIEEKGPAESVAQRVVHGRPKSEAAALEQRELKHARVLHPLGGSRVGHQLFDETEIRIVEMIDGMEGEVHGGTNEGDALTGGAPDFEAAVLVLTAAKGGGEWVVVHKGLGEGGREEWEGVAGGGAKVNAKVAEGELKVGIGVEVREREDMVVEEGRARREYESSL